MRSDFSEPNKVLRTGQFLFSYMHPALMPIPRDDQEMINPYEVNVDQLQR
jgi:hypothetical protein